MIVMELKIKWILSTLIREAQCRLQNFKHDTSHRAMSVPCLPVGCGLCLAI